MNPLSLRRSSHRRHSPLVAAGLLAVIAGLAPVCAAKDDLPYFSPAKIDAFDGRSWAGLTLGQTTQDGVKHQFRNGRGDFSSSVLLEQDNAKDVPYRISALYGNKDKEARLDGICIKYKDDRDGIPLAKLETALGGSGTVLYPTRRFEDWHVAAYPDRGVILFVVGDHVPMILLGYPERIANTLSMLRPEEPRIERYMDQFVNRERILRYGSTSASFDLKGISLYDQDRERRVIERRLRDHSAGGYIVYDPGITGSSSYTISVTAKYAADKGGDGSVEADLRGDGPFGPLESRDRETFKIDKGSSDRHLDDTGYDRAMDDAVRTVERDMARQVRLQQPPPVETVRRGDADRVIDKYRFHSQTGAPLTGGGAGGGGGLVD